MSAGLQTAVAGWRFVGGGVVERPAGLLVEERSDLGAAPRGRGNLYVLVDLEGPAEGRDELAQALVQTVRQAYYGERGSVTGGLRQALHAANQALLRWNQNQPYDQQRTASAACLVLRGTDAYAAHVGDVVTLVVQDGDCQAFPETRERLGVRRGVEPAFYHISLEAGQTFLMASGDLIRLRRPTDLGAWVKTKGPLGAVAAAATPARADLLALSIEVSGEREEAAPSVRERLAGGKEAPARAQARTGGRSRAAARALRDAFLAGLAVLLLLLRGVATLVGRLVPPSAGVERGLEPRARRDEPRRVGAWAVLLALAIPLAVALIAGAIYWQRGREAEAQFRRLLGEAQSLYQTASQTEDRVQARGMYLEALERAGQAEQIRPGTDEVRQLREALQARLRQVDRVVPLYGLAALWTYQTPGSRPTRIVAYGQDLFVLDRGTGTVHRHVLSESLEVLKEGAEDEVILRKGDVVGNVVVGDLLDIVWMPAGGERTQSSLLILESGGRILAWQPNWGTQPLQVYGTENWRAPTLLRSFTQGRLYLLDPPQRQILRYPPTRDGYTSPPEKYFVAEGGEDLQGVVDLAIDGFVYLLYGDGRIAKYEMGQPLPFAAQPPPDGWKGVTALFTGPDTGTASAVRYLYVADADGRRVVRLSKDGEFLCQYVAPDDDPQALADLRGLFVDEEQGLMFLVSGRTLYRSPFRLE
ncbi:MAG: hypothetical protein ACP5UM_11250 [Anaerolineae bacterium]